LDIVRRSEKGNIKFLNYTKDDEAAQILFIPISSSNTLSLLISLHWYLCPYLFGIQFKDVLANGDKIELLLKENGSIFVIKSSLKRAVIYISDNQRNITAIFFSTTEDVNNIFYYAIWNNLFDKSITISQFVFEGNQLIKKSEVIKHKALH